MHDWQVNTWRTCAQPILIRAMPENEIPPAMRVDYYFLRFEEFVFKVTKINSSKNETFIAKLRLSSKYSNRQQAKGFWQMESRSGKACFSSRKEYRSALIIKQFRTYSSYRRGESMQSPLP